ncbi:hypothetical protein BC829DRAFT_398532 [Chytridium lagenaria]|nr:hypothetical protein BC829DRAFT_398532 [Chytridium lagenaria]
MIHKLGLAIFCVVAASQTVPLIVAQGLRDDALAVDSTSMQKQDVFEALKKIRCPKVALVVEQQSVRNTIIPFVVLTQIVARFEDGESTISIPYVFGADGLTDEITEVLSAKCDLTVETVSSEDSLGKSKGKLFKARLPNFKGRSDRTELEVMAQNDLLFGDWMADLRDISNDYLIVFTSGSASRYKTPVPFAKRPFFVKYIVFNNGIFEGAVTLIIVSVISLIGINILSAIQGPTRFESKKD